MAGDPPKPDPETPAAPTAADIPPSMEVSPGSTEAPVAAPSTGDSATVTGSSPTSSPPADKPTMAVEQEDDLKVAVDGDKKDEPDGPEGKTTTPAAAAKKKDKDVEASTFLGEALMVANAADEKLGIKLGHRDSEGNFDQLKNIGNALKKLVGSGQLKDNVGDGLNPKNDSDGITDNPAPSLKVAGSGTSPAPTGPEEAKEPEEAVKTPSLGEAPGGKPTPGAEAKIHDDPESSENEKAGAKAGAQIGGEVGQKGGEAAGEAAGAEFGPVGSAIGKEVGGNLGKEVGTKVGAEVADTAGKTLDQGASPGAQKPKGPNEPPAPKPPGGTENKKEEEKVSPGKPKPPTPEGGGPKPSPLDAVTEKFKAETTTPSGDIGGPKGTAAKPPLVMSSHGQNAISGKPSTSFKDISNPKPESPSPPSADFHASSMKM